ncbi:MAG: ribosome-associated translation inhibitor RaiA [Jiangellales bacterium]
MEIVVRGRKTEVPERFREHVQDKLAKLAKYDDRLSRIDVEVTRENNPRQADEAERVEITARSKGPVIRAEAAAPDRYAALDTAVGRLEARLRRAADRRHDRRKAGASTGMPDGLPEPLAADLPPVAALDGPEEPALSEAEDAALIVRDKTHEAEPMSLDQALYEMELVGHDFYLFVDAQSRLPSVVYRRRGYQYGVIRLAV